MENYLKAGAQPELEVSVLQLDALYRGIGVLFLYLLAIPLVFSITRRQHGGWRPSRDMAFPANIVAMLYDSSLVEMMREGATASLEKEPSMKNGSVGHGDWKGMQWGFGIFQGVSGKKRVGIETVDKLEVIGSSIGSRPSVMPWGAPQP